MSEVPEDPRAVGRLLGCLFGCVLLLNAVQALDVYAEILCLLSGCVVQLVVTIPPASFPQSPPHPTFTPLVGVLLFECGYS